MASDEVRRHFEKQGKGCERLGSPFTARLCRLLPDILDESTKTGRRVLNWPGEIRADALALRLCGGLHALVLSGDDPELAECYPPNAASDVGLREAVSAAIARHDDRLCQGLDSAPQTNEIARSGMLLPGFLTIAKELDRPLDLYEIGSSAGLNLLFDQFYYRYGDARWGDEASPVHLAPEVRGQPPLLDGDLKIAARKGSDIAPIDVSRRAARLRLTSYIWPDQQERLKRLEAAIGLASREPFDLDPSDAARFVESSLVARKPGNVFVLFHSIMWQYLPAETHQRIEHALSIAGAPDNAPIAWLRMEPASIKDAFATVSLTLWPGGSRRDLARCDYHGRWIEWIAD